MNPKRLLEVYEQISEAPDAIARLRRFVLNLAVRGKLVEQDAGDEPVKLPHDKRLVSPVKPVPSGWVASTVGQVLNFQYGKGKKKSERLEKGPIPVFGSNGIVGFTDEQLTENDAIIVGRKGSAGALNLCFGPSWTTDVAYFVEAPAEFQIRYLLLAFQALSLDTLGKGVKPGLSRADAYPLEIHIPPLAEQHRIVAKFDELMALCDRLEEARKTREETRDKLTAASLARLTAPDTTAEDFPAHAAFALESLPALTTRPDQIQTLRQTILNLAVRGKLAEQDPADEPASELLNEITRKRESEIEAGSRKKDRPLGKLKNDEIPLPRPEGWAFDLLQHVIDVRDGTHDTPAASSADDAVALVTSKDFKDGRIDFENTKRISLADHIEISKRSLVEVGDILFSMIGGNIGNQVMVSDPRPFSIKNVALFKYYDTSSTLPKFIKIYMEDLANRLQAEASGGAQPFVSLGALRKLPIGLPPLAEQHRIVAKVDALMTLCDRLEAALTTTDTTRTRLLEALLHEALQPTTEIMAAAE